MTNPGAASSDAGERASPNLEDTASPAVRRARKVRFGPYEADLSSGELHKGGSKLRIQPQPFNLLSLLLRRHGDVVTRQELQQALWPNDTYVEFNASLNAAIKKLRRTIMDDPRNPRYIETLPRTGYRFSFPVEWVQDPPLSLVRGTAAPAVVPAEAGREQRADRGVADSGTEAQSAAAVRVGGEPAIWATLRRALTAGRVLTFALAVALLAGAYWRWTAPVPRSPVRRFAIHPGAGVSEFGGSISPDGLHVLYAVLSDGRRRLMLRSLDSETAHELPGTAGAVGGFWAPDSRSVGFATDRELKAVSLAGEEPLTVCQLPETDVPFGGGSWSADGQRIAFSSGALLYEVPAAGGQPRLLFERGGSFRSNYSNPHFLPSRASNALVYTAAVSPFDQMLAVFDLETGENRTLGPGSAPVYSPDGHLVYGPANRDDSGLMAMPFSLDTLEPTGRGFVINGRGIKPSVSQDGVLVYLEQANNPLQMVWRDRQGVLLEEIGPRQLGLRLPAISPHSGSIAVTSQEVGDSDIWIVEPAGGRTTQLTFDPGIDDGAAWSPDGSKIVFSRQGRSGEGGSILSKAASGEGDAAVIVSSPGRIASPEWSHDGRYLAYADYSGGPRSDIRYLVFDNGVASEPRTLLGTAANEYSPKFFPSVGRYIAYVSNQTGRDEVYVARFPGATDIQKVSLNGGRRARWRSDGVELYYVEGITLVAVPVSITAQGNLSLGRPQRLFETPDLGAAGYAPSADGRRFVTVTTAASTVPALPSLHVVENWYEEHRDAVR